METSTSTSTSTPKSSTRNRKEYMRDYHRKRYLADADKAKSYRNSLRCRLKENITEEEWSKYKHHLADIVKLQDILKKLPKELIDEIMTKELN